MKTTRIMNYAPPATPPRPGTLQDMVEPYLLQAGMLARTRQGRRITDLGRTRAEYAPKPGGQMELGEGTGT